MVQYGMGVCDCVGLLALISPAYIFKMNKNQILVRNIKHLTDARYFAAMGADWMSMELNNDPTSFMKWHTLKDWVAGVKLAAEIDTTDEMLLAKTIIDALPDGIIVHNLSPFELSMDIQLFYDAQSIEGIDFPDNSFKIIRYDQSMELQPILSTDPGLIFLQSEWTQATLEKILKTGYAGGICFSGGEEDATGIRDYEMLDELFGMITE